MNFTQPARFLWLMTAVLLAACQQVTINNQQITVNSQQPTAAAQQATMTPTPPTATAVPTPTPTVTPTPTATAMPLIRFAVPTQWQTAGERAIATLSTGGRRRWQLLISDDPAADLADGLADVALIANESGQLVHQEPLILAVPFTSEWENVTESDARAILSDGRPLVTAMPWAELTPDLKPLRVDGRHPTDPDYPLQTAWSLRADDGLEEVAAAISHWLREEMDEEMVTMTAVGDIMLSRTLGWYLTQGDLTFPFAQFQPILSQSDLALGNLETALGDAGAPEEKRYPFQSPPEAAAALALAGFDILSFANNHAMDYGAEALLQARDLLAVQNIAAIGAGENETAAHAPLIQEINGIRLALLAYVHVPVEASNGFDTADWTATADAPGVAWADPERIRQDVAQAKIQADLVIVLLHSGLEYIEAPGEAQTAAAHAAIEAGAALVIGHHPHVLQGIEFYQNGVIVYSLGNFAFDITGPPETAVLQLWLDADGVRQLELIPAIVQPGGQPRPATSAEAAAIRRQVYRLTNLLNN